jgi:hypothetical protein
MAKNKPQAVPESDPPQDEPKAAPATEAAASTEEQLDADEEEFRKLRRDLPGVKGASAAGTISISVGKAPTKNEFFRVHPNFRPILQLVDNEVGLEKQYFAVTPSMVEALAAIDIKVADYVLYLTVTSRGATRIVPIRCANEDGNQNEYARTKEIAMLQAIDAWVRLSTDQENQCYKAFPAPIGRFGEPKFQDLKPAKIIRLGFRDKGRLIDSTEHVLFQKWAARDSDK